MARTLKNNVLLLHLSVIAECLSVRQVIVQCGQVVFVYIYICILISITHIIYIYYIRHTLIVRGLEATCSMYQGVGRQCASSI